MLMVSHFFCVLFLGLQVIADVPLDQISLGDEMSYQIDHHDVIEESEDYWRQKNIDEIIKQLNKVPNTNVAKNIILFIGDGLSLSTITSGRIFDGQRHKQSGENNVLSWEEFPFTGISKTYCVDKLVPDSACTATAYWTGVKNNYATLGVTGKVKLKDCAAINKNTTLKSILDYAQEVGKATGIVTNTRVTHASPAGGYAHSANRNYEVDAEVLKDDNDISKCIDIAKQLVSYSPGKDVNVVLGGGSVYFLPTFKEDKYGNPGLRLDKIDLIEEWRMDKRNRNLGKEAVVWDVQGLKKVDYNATVNLLGLFSPSHMSYNLDADRSKEPTLEEMTEAAIKVLSQNEKGFLLFVENGKIDLGHHETQAVKALDETVELSKAVNKAVSITDPSETLIVVTSDHSHTMTISGYPARGTDILQFAGKSEMDGMPYTILSYANGKNAGRTKLYQPDLGHPNSIYPSLVPLKDETHSGEDVMVFASGPWAHLFSGVYEQTTIPSLMSYAACIGPTITACNRKENRQPTSSISYH